MSAPAASPSSSSSIDHGPRLYASVVIRSLVMTLAANYPDLGRERVQQLVIEVAGDTKKFFRNSAGEVA